MNVINTEETERQYRVWKYGKAPREDDLPVHTLKAVGADGIKLLRHVFHIVRKQDRLPEDWGKAIVCPLYIKEKKLQKL